MAKHEITERPKLDKLIGHYRAFDQEGTVIWEKKDFEVSKEMSPPGLSLSMKYSTVTVGGKIVRKWDPQNLLSK